MCGNFLGILTISRPRKPLAANKARTGNVLGLHMIFHDRLMLGHILAFGAAVQAVAVVPVHQGLDLRVQLRRGPRDYEIRVI